MTLGQTAPNEKNESEKINIMKFLRAQNFYTPKKCELPIGPQSSQTNF